MHYAHNSRSVLQNGTASCAIRVYRARLLSLWVIVVAERDGYSQETVLTRGRAMCSAAA